MHDCRSLRPAPRGPTSRLQGRACLPAAVALILAAAVLLAPFVARPAFGHAAGPPPQATVSGAGSVVTIDWVAEPDDAAAVGVAVGLLPPEVVDAYLGRGPIEDLPSDAMLERLAQSPQLRAYLLANVTVTQAGAACRGEVVETEAFLTAGARLQFTCPAPVEQVELGITLLHDQDPRYRTFGVDGTIQSTVHTSTQPTHTWDLTGAAAGAGGAGRAAAWFWPLAVLAGVGALVGAAARIVLRRRVRYGCDGEHGGPT